MAGSQFERLKNQLHIFVSVKLDPSTPQGKNRLIMLGLWLFLAVFLLYQHSGSNKDLSRTHNRHRIQLVDTNVNEEEISPEIDEGNQNLLFGGDQEDEEDDDEREKKIVSRKVKHDDDSEEDSSDGDAVDDNIEQYKTLQQTRLREKGAKILDFFKKFRADDEVEKHFKLLQSTYSDLNLISSEIIGKTDEKRNIILYKMGKGESGKSILVIGLEHASEWPATMALSYFATRMLQLYYINDDATSLMNQLHVYVIPVFNPDGLAYTMSSTKHRFEQFNKEKGKGSHVGVDLSLDFGVFSQSETKSLKNWISGLINKRNEKVKLDGFVNVHCCGEAVIVPMLRDCVANEAKQDVLKLGSLMIESMSDSSENSYKLMQQESSSSKKTRSSRRSKDVENSGYAVNYIADALNVKYSYTLEGRGNKKRKSNPVDVPVSDIIPVSREITKGILKLGLGISEDANSDSTGCGENGKTVSTKTKKKAKFEDEEEAEGDGSKYVDDDETDSFSKADVEDDDEDGKVEGEFNADTSSDEDMGDSEENDDDSNDEDMDRSSSATHKKDNSEDEDDSDGFEMTEDDGEDQTVEKDEMNEDEEDVSDDGEHEQFEEDSKEAQGSEEEEDEEQEPEDEQVLSPVVQNHLRANPTLDIHDPNTFLYFAYNADMLYDVLLVSGITSAWKVANARLDDYAFDYTYYSRKTWRSGIADAFKNKNSHLWGVVYRINKSELALLKTHNLDFSDEITALQQRGESTGGKRSRMLTMSVLVEDRNGNFYECVTFRVAEKLIGEEVYKKYRRFPPSRQYKNCVIKGAKQQRLPLDYIERLRGISPMFSDKIGMTKYRNPSIGTVCDPERNP